MSEASGILCGMDAALVTVVALACLAAGLLAGWFAATARAGEHGAADRADLTVRLAAAETAETLLRAQLEQQLEHERGRRRTVESAMVAAGVQLPPESPIPTPRESADAH